MGSHAKNDFVRRDHQADIQSGSTQAPRASICRNPLLRSKLSREFGIEHLIHANDLEWDWR